MSKADQLRALREARSKQRRDPAPKRSDGGGESRPAPKTDARKRVGGTKVVGLLRQTDSSVGRAGPSQGSGRQFESASDLAGVAPGPSEANSVKRGRPRIGEPKSLRSEPWKALGMSERTYRRRLAEQRKEQK